MAGEVAPDERGLPGIGAFEGRVLEISDGCVFIETEQGDVSVPGEHFTQQPFVKLRKSP